MATATKKQTSTGDRILKLLKGRRRGLTAKDIAAKLDANPNTVRGLLTTFAQDGIVEATTADGNSGGRRPLIYTSKEVQR